MFQHLAFRLCITFVVGILFLVGLENNASAFQPPTRRHTKTQSSGKPKLVVANKKPSLKNQVTIAIEGNQRVIRSNGIPDHFLGAFPNRGNPHQVTGQKYIYRIPAEPKASSRFTISEMFPFGVAVNGIPFDPGAAEWYQGLRNSVWQYEALSGAVPLGLDTNMAHVQPTGAYHYHGLPTNLMKSLKSTPETHSPLVGWAADGFPIYAMYGFKEAKNKESGVKELAPSYRLKQGNRPRGQGNPGGKYDGTFIADYEYVQGQGDLDECNGRFCVTPEFPDGTYAYFLTKDWPVIPRAFRGTPSQDFRQRLSPQNHPRGGPGGRRPNRPPPPRRRQGGQ